MFSIVMWPSKIMAGDDDDDGDGGDDNDDNCSYNSR